MRHILRSRFIVVVSLAVIAAFGAAPAAFAQNVTSQQRDELKDVALETRRKTEQARNELRGARTDLAAQYARYDMDERRVRSSLDRLSKAQHRLLQIHLENQVRVRQVLKPEQFAQFNTTMRKQHEDRGYFGSPLEQAMEELPDRAMLGALDLSSASRNRLASTVSSPERKRAADKLRKDTRQLIDLYSNYRLDKAAASRLIESLHNSQVDLAQANLKKQQTLRSALSKSQFDKMQQLIASRVKSLQPSRPRPRR